ncbi:MULTISPECIES: hypothetical protein [Cysteiniphilum]|uniref:hypothetical protein n=1 Tax=Cysteiniphilum TaxID=2056696 RepID=UPI00178453AB|nr:MULTISPECIES: hypothetical protein [Cysteiniphilum]
MKTITKTLAASVLLTASIIGGVNAASTQGESLSIHLSANVPDTDAAYYTVNVANSQFQFSYDLVADDFTGDSTPVTINVGNGEITALNVSAAAPLEITHSTDPTKKIGYAVKLGTQAITTTAANIFTQLGNPDGTSIVDLTIDPETYDDSKHVEGNYSGNLNLLFDGTLS